MIPISVCVCTYRRPGPLRRLLTSVASLDLATPPIEVVVVDNDAARSAEEVVHQARAAGLDVRYLVEPVRGIARARNRAVAEAVGRWVAFVDDDEEADPFWLLELWLQVTRHGADGGLGPVLPKLDPHAPGWLVEGRFFERPRFPTGMVLAAAQMRTGNAFVLRERLSALAGPFDERLDLTGGEDVDLFARLIGGGCRFVAVDSAVVHEHLPLARANLRWLLLRRFRGGVGAARLYLATTPASARQPWQRMRPLTRALVWGAAGAALYFASRTGGTALLSRAAAQLGRLAFHAGWSFEPYRRDPSW